MCIQVYNYYTFLINCTFYHYIGTIQNGFLPKILFPVINKAMPVFFQLAFAYNRSFYPFILEYSVFLFFGDVSYK